MIRKLRDIFSNTGEKRVKKDLVSLKSNVMDSFSHIRTDMKDQKKWIDYLHSNHQKLNELHNVLHDKHHHHQEVHAKDIDNINKWIDHLHASSKDQEKYMRELEQNISSAFEKYNRYLVDLYKMMAKFTAHKEESELAQARPKTRLDAQTPRPEKEDYNSVMSEEDETKPDYLGVRDIQENNKAFISGETPESKDEGKPLSYYSDVLTRSEKNILAELCNTSQKMSYRDIAVLTNLSANTVKNHICHIKKKGFPVQEQNDSKGIKRYFVHDNVKKVLLSKNI